jgi:hypothetical protein
VWIWSNKHPLEHDLHPGAGELRNNKGKQSIMKVKADQRQCPVDRIIVRESCSRKFIFGIKMT